MLIFHYKKAKREQFFNFTLFLIYKIDQLIFSIKFLSNNLIKKFFFVSPLRLIILIMRKLDSLLIKC